MDCVFCKIVNGEIPSKKIYEDDLVYAFHDINPVTPVHFLVIPKEHISGANDIDESNSQIVAHIFEVIAKLAKEFDIDKSGYRIVNNCGEDGGQTVHHMHFHVLGKKNLAGHKNIVILLELCYTILV